MPLGGARQSNTEVSKSWCVTRGRHRPIGMACHRWSTPDRGGRTKRAVPTLGLSPAQGTTTLHGGKNPACRGPTTGTTAVLPPLGGSSTPPSGKSRRLLPVAYHKKPHFVPKEPPFCTNKPPGRYQKTSQNVPKQTLFVPKKKLLLTLPEWTPTNPICANKNTLSPPPKKNFSSPCMEMEKASLVARFHTENP